MPKLPIFKQGIIGSSLNYSDTASGPPLEQLKSGASLSQLREEYILFTYAPLFLYGGLQHNPIQEWINLTNVGKVIYILPLKKPILELGFGQSNQFNSILWAVEKKYSSNLAAHLGGMGLIDRQNKTLTKTVCQEIPVFDEGANITDNILPRTSIYTFGVNSNKNLLVFEPAKNLDFDKPTLVRYQPLPETVRLAEALFKNENNPYEKTI